MNTRELTAVEKRETLDRFVADMTSTVKLYACFGCYQNIEPCARCSVKGHCKQETPRWAYQ